VIRITVLTLALALPLQGGFVGPEVPLSTPVLDAAPGSRGAPQVASNGREFLVVWPEEGAVRAARVDNNGVIRDREPLLVSRTTGDWPAVAASDGRHYVIAHPCGEAVCLAQVDADTGDVAARGSIANARDAAIASDGRGYLVAYHGSGASVAAVPLRADGTIAGPAFAVAQSEFAPALASNGLNYFVVFGSSARLEGLLLSDKGVRAARQQFAEGGVTAGYRVAAGDDGFLVTWGQRGATDDAELRAATVSRSGIASPAKAIHPRAGQQHDVAWNGTRYVVAYTPLDGTDVTSFEVSASGDAVSDAVAIAATPDFEASSSLAWNNQKVLVAWYAHSGAGSEVEARFLAPNGLSQVLVVSYGIPAQRSIAAMRNLTRTTVAWDENHGPRQIRKVYLQRLDAHGMPLDGRGLPVSDSPRHQLRPALGGSAIAWLETDAPNDPGADVDVWAMAIDGLGQPAGAPLHIGNTTGDARLAVVNPGGTTTFVVWPSKEGRLMATRVARFGVQAPSLTLANGQFPTDPDLATNGSGFLAAWNDGPMYVGAFTQTGQPVGPPTRFESVRGRALVWNGTAYVAFWSANDPAEAFAQQLNASGVRIGAVRSLGPFVVDDAVWTGEEYRVAFHGDGVQESLWIARLDRDFREIASFPTLARQAGEGVVLFDDMILYLAPYRGTESVSPRVVMRRLGEDASPPRRRAVR
jgi:hypothetical protein